MAEAEKREARNGPPRKTTLKDVAARVGVSPMTVSKMLNGKGGVSKETSKRIWKAIRELSYTPNLVAKSLRVNKTRTFGLVTSDSSELLFPKMIKGVIDAAAAADYSVIIANGSRSGEKESECIRVLLNKRIDGLILGAPFVVNAARVEEVASFSIPMVLLMRSSPLPVDWVASDNVRGGYDQMSYLMDRGFREFYFLALSREHQNGMERLEGCRRAMLERGLPFNAGRVRYLAPSVHAGYEEMRRLLAGGLRGGTMVCGCDVIAVGAVQAILDSGLCVPGDFGVCGFDDIEMLDFMNVPLTTMRQDVYGMGREGVRILLERMGNPSMSPAQVRFGCKLVERRSV